MADKGTVGMDAGMMAVVGTLGQPTISKIRILSGEVHQFGITKDTSEGSPSQPSMKAILPHRRRFLWPVASGTRTISVDVKFSVDNGTGFRPMLVIKANAEVGIAADVVTEAAAGAGSYKTIGPVTVNPNAQGTLEVELRFDPVLGSTSIIHWDNVAVT